MNANPIKLHKEDLSVTLDQSAEEQRDALIAETKQLESVDDEIDEQTAADYLKRLKALNKAVEESRKKVKAPINNLGRKIDGLAKDFSLPAKQEEDRVQKLINAHYKRERERIERERREAEEAKRRAEEERRQAEKARRKAEEETERQQAQSEFLEATEQANEASQNAQNLEGLRKAEEQAKQQELAAAAQPAPTKTKAEGTIVRQPWRYKVTDINKLYEARPDLCKLQEKPSAIQAALRQGDRDIPGLEIWQDVDVGVRT